MPSVVGSASFLSVRGDLKFNVYFSSNRMRAKLISSLLLQDQPRMMLSSFLKC